MEERIEPENWAERAGIGLLGIGGGGCNVTAALGRADVPGARVGAANTDGHSLEGSGAPVRIALGPRLTGGLGTGADPERGRLAALESETELRRFVRGLRLLVIATGLGGGTGTGAAPVVARIAREEGVLCVAIVTMPFRAEGARRRLQAQAGLELLRRDATVVVVVENDRLQRNAGALPLLDAFAVADAVVVGAMRGIVDLVRVRGVVNRDFADLCTVLARRGRAVIGLGSATGPDRAVQAARLAVASPVVSEDGIGGAGGILVNVAGGADMTLDEVGAAIAVVEALGARDAALLAGAMVDPALGAEMRVLVVATGIGGDRPTAEPRPVYFRTPSTTQGVVS